MQKTVIQWTPYARRVRKLRRDRQMHDFRAAEGILLSVLMGFNVLVWSYVIVRTFL